MIGGDFTSRLNMNLREDKHWSYGARSSAIDREHAWRFAEHQIPSDAVVTRENGDAALTAEYSVVRRQLAHQRVLCAGLTSPEWAFRVIGKQMELLAGIAMMDGIIGKPGVLKLHSPEGFAKLLHCRSRIARRGHPFEQIQCQPQSFALFHRRLLGQMPSVARL